MARILLLDADAETRTPIRGSMVEQGHEVLEAAHTDEALALAQEGVDLVIADARPPGANGLDFRDTLRQATQDAPFVFLSQATPEDHALLARLVADEYLFLKPPDLPELARTVGALLGALRKIEGDFATQGSLDGILAQIADESETGVLTAFQGPVIKKIVFDRGVVAYCGSNDPTDYIGQALIRAGVISEENLIEAMSAQTSGALLGQVLQGLGRVTSEQIDDTIQRKFKDTLLGLYLWTEGTWTYIAGGVDPSEVPQPVRVEIQPLRIEGRRRAARWRELVNVFASDDMSFAVHPERFPAGFPKTGGDKRLMQLAGSGRTLGQIRMELRGQDFAVLSRFNEFLKHGVVSLRQGVPQTGPTPEDEHTPVSTSAPSMPAADELAESEPENEPDSEPAVSESAAPIEGLLETAAAALDNGDLEAARIMYEDVLRLDPTNALARSGLAEVGAQITANAASDGLTLDTQVQLAIRMDELDLSSVQPAEAFLLSRLAGGPAVVRELVQISPLGEDQVIEVLQGLRARNIVS